MASGRFLATRFVVDPQVIVGRERRCSVKFFHQAHVWTQIVCQVPAGDKVFGPRSYLQEKGLVDTKHDSKTGKLSCEPYSNPKHFQLPGNLEPSRKPDKVEGLTRTKRSELSSKKPSSQHLRTRTGNHWYSDMQ